MYTCTLRYKECWGKEGEIETERMSDFCERGRKEGRESEHIGKDGHIFFSKDDSKSLLISIFHNNIQKQGDFATELEILEHYVQMDEHTHKYAHITYSKQRVIASYER